MNTAPAPDTTTPTVREYNIPAYLREAAEDKVTKVNRRITKLGLTPYVVTFAAGPMIPNYDDSGCRTVINGIPHYFENGRPVPCPIIDWEATVDVTITGELPRLGDWEAVAVLTRDADGPPTDGPPTDGPAPVITRVFPGLGVEPDLTAFRGTDPVCEHCHTNRDRIDTFVVRHRVTGEMKQVGRNCLAAYTGIDLRIPTWLYSDGLDEMDEWSQTRGGGGEPYLTVVDVLETTCRVAAKFGWVSRQMERDSMGQRTATADIVATVMRGRTESDRKLREDLAGTPDLDKVGRIRECAITLRGEGTEYGMNLATLAEGEWVSTRNLPLLCSAYTVWSRRETERVERANRPESTWQGEVKQRLKGLVLTVVHTSIIPGYYGDTTLIIMVGEAGAKFKWFATGTHEYDTGTVLTLDGTVKGHEEYKGEKRTILTRCKVTACETPATDDDAEAVEETPADDIIPVDGLEPGWYCRACDTRWTGSRDDHTNHLTLQH